MQEWQDPRGTCHQRGWRCWQLCPCWCTPAVGLSHPTCHQRLGSGFLTQSCWGWGLRETGSFWLQFLLIASWPSGSDIHTGHWAAIWAVDHPERDAGCKDWHYYATHPNMQTDQVVKTDVMLQLCPPPDDLWIPIQQAWVAELQDRILLLKL